MIYESCKVHMDLLCPVQMLVQTKGTVDVKKKKQERVPRLIAPLGSDLPQRE